MFAVFRHPEVGLGVCPEQAAKHYRDNGWVRVSEWNADPSDLHLELFSDATEDLDAPEKPATKPAPAAPADTKESKA